MDILKLVRMPSVHALTICEWVVQLTKKIKWLSFSWFTLDLAVGAGKNRMFFLRDNGLFLQ